MAHKVDLPQSVFLIFYIRGVKKKTGMYTHKQKPATKFTAHS